MAHVVRCKPSTLEQLKQVVEDFATHFDPEKARAMARHTRYRAQLCVNLAGGHFEHLVRKMGSGRSENKTAECDVELYHKKIQTFRSDQLKIKI